MALGKYARVDGRKPSSNYCSIVTLIMFVALCLVGVWMMKSSSMVPFQYLDFSSQESETELKKMTENDSQQFEDNRGDLLEDAMKGDGITVSYQHESNSDVKKKQNLPEKTNENAIEESQEEKSVKESVDRNTRSEESSNNKNENDRNRNSENEETNIEDKKEISAAAETENKVGGGETTNTGEEKEFKEGLGEKSKLDKGERKSDMEKSGEIHQEDKVEDHTEEVEQNQEKGSKQDQVLNEVFPSGAQSELLNETTAQLGGWSTQSVESKNEKEEQQSLKNKHQNEYNWKLCNVTSGSDYIPCLDNIQAIRKLPSTMHYEHRERHCPEESPTCLVPLPEKYKRPIEWPESREKIWYYNVPHTKLAEFKGHQNWVKVTGNYLTFPGGGTQFKHGALRYIDFIQGSVPDIAWGKRSRVILDVGCGVASFGGFLFERDVLTMSFAPKDEHEAQVQFALERGIPAISAVMGTKRLPFPGMVFDIVHCARCRVPWHIEGGKLLLELNRLLRPGGFFVWSATPVYQKRKEEDVEIWKAMSGLTKSMCWELLTIKKDKVNGVGAAIYRKPTSNDCYERREQNEPPLCQESDDLNAAWNVALQACMHKVPVEESERGSHWPKEWPARLNTPPYWLKSSQVGVYGKSAPEDFVADYEHWKHVVSNSYLNGMGINWSSVRNVMDMRSLYGGFAAALRDMKVWVMNVVPIDSPDTLPIIYERGLFGIYHDWCESFSTYPRSYDLLHADHLFSKLLKRCNLVAMMAEVDRILRPGGKLIVRDHDEIIGAVEMLARSLRWEIRLTYSNNKEGLLCIEKTMWRPTEVETIASAIA